MTHVDLLRTFVAQPCCRTLVARLSWVVAELHNPNLNSNLLLSVQQVVEKLSTDWSVVVCLLLAL